MAKLEVGDKELRKFLDESTIELIKSLEKQIKSLEAKVMARDRTIAELRSIKDRANEAIREMKYIASSVHSWVDCEEW